MTTIPAHPRPLTGRMVLAMLVAFFGIVIGVNLLMIKLAMESLPGTVVDSAYGASLAFNADIASARDQDARHWTVEARLTRDKGNGADISLKAVDGRGAPLVGIAFRSRLERPTDRRADLRVDLDEAGGGVYRGHIAFVAAGQWTLVIEADADGERKFLSQNRIVLVEERS